MKRHIEHTFDFGQQVVKPQNGLKNTGSSEQATKGLVADDDDDPEADDVEGKHEQKRRRRQCKSRTKTDSDLKIMAAKTYLGSLGVTYSFAQTFHGKYGLGVSKCNQFASLAPTLLDGQLPRCLTCASMLKFVNFKMGDLQSAVGEAIDQKMLSSPATTKLRELKSQMRDDNVRESLGQQLALTDGDVPDTNLQLVPAPASGMQSASPNADVSVEGKGQDNANLPAAEDDDGDDDDIPSIDAVRKCLVRIGQGHFLEALPLNSMDKRVPIRCRVCRSARQKDGKVFEAHKVKTVEHFVKQHLRGATHVAAFSRYVQQQSGNEVPVLADDPSGMKPCEGMSLTHDPNIVSFQLASEIVLWAKFTNLKTSLTKHQYYFDVKEQELIVRHEDCEKIARVSNDHDRVVCMKCSNPEVAKSSLRTAIRLALKHWCARILQARLLRSEEFATSLVDSFKSSALFKLNQARAQELLDYNNADLQTWVRNSWMKVSAESMTEVALDFREIVVKPLLLINVRDCQAPLKRLADEFACHLATGQLSEMDSLNLKIIEAASSGRLESNPAIMGIFLRCVEFMDKPNLKGQARRSMTDKERDMCEEAAILLVTNGCKGSLLKSLGVSRESTLRSHLGVGSLLAQGLPCPGLCLLDSENLKQNLSIIDSLIQRAPGVKYRRRLVMAFDFTYLLPMHTPMQIWGKKALVGAPFCMSDLTSESPGSLQPVSRGEPLVERTKANRMLLRSCIDLIWCVL